MYTEKYYLKFYCLYCSGEININPGILYERAFGPLFGFDIPTIQKGTTNLTFLKKIKNIVPVMGAKLKSKTHLLNTFFWFLSRFMRVWLQGFQKMLLWTKNMFFWKNQKRYQKTQNFTPISNPLKKLVKNAQKKLKVKQVCRTWVKVKIVHISITFLLINFFGAFFQNFFNGFEISVKFCVGILWLQRRTKRLKKQKIFFMNVS